MHLRRFSALKNVPAMAVVAALAVTGLTQVGAAPALNTPVRSVSADSNAVDTSSAAAVRRAYTDRWLPATRTSMALTGGSTTSCARFTTSAAQQQATGAAVNFARGLVGESGVGFTATYNQAAADAALIMAANSQLSHDPPKSWSCWTQSGHDAAAKSDILINSTTPSAARIAELYLDEPGSSNTAVGHRRWLLRPEATTMGSGNARGDWFGNALYVFTFGDDNAGAPAKPYYAWPSAGYFPTQLEPAGRWSLSSSTSASFAHARVSVAGPDGAAVPVTQYAAADGYGDNTLAWNLNSAPAMLTAAAPQTYTVTVSGITGGPAPTYTYYVRLFDPSAPVPAGEPASLPVDQPIRQGASQVSTSTGLTVSKPRTTRHGRIKVRLWSTAADGRRPTGRVTLYVGRKRFGSYALGPSNKASRVLRIGWSNKGRKPLRAVFRGSGAYADSVSRTVSVRVH